MRKIKSYFKGVAQEARRVRWPHKREFWSSVAVVMTVTVVAALVILFLDFLTLQVIKGFEDNFSKDSSSSSSAAAMLIGLVKGRF